jgi:hypothetical protein
VHDLCDSYASLRDLFLTLAGAGEQNELFPHGYYVMPHTRGRVILLAPIFIYLLRLFGATIKYKNIVAIVLVVLLYATAGRCPAMERLHSYSNMNKQFVLVSFAFRRNLCKMYGVANPPYLHIKRSFMTLPFRCVMQRRLKASRQ